MCYYDNRNTKLLIQFPEQILYHIRCLGIDCTCRLICQKYLRVICKCDRDRNSLLLTTGHLRRIRIHLFLQSHFT